MSGHYVIWTYCRIDSKSKTTAQWISKIRGDCSDLGLTLLDAIILDMLKIDVLVDLMCGLSARGDFAVIVRALMDGIVLTML